VAEPVTHVGVDETAFQRRHEYVTVVTDLRRTRVLYVGDERRQETLDRYWASVPLEHRQAVEAVAMDLWEPYIRSTLTHVPDAEAKIVFDKFPMA
jgi:transposase